MSGGMPEDFFGRAVGVVAGFFEQGEKAKVGMGEVDFSNRLLGEKTVLGEESAWCGNGHGMAPEPDVEVPELLAELGVRACEVLEDFLAPSMVALLKGPFPGFCRGKVVEWAVPGDDGGTRGGVEALMGGDHVAERGGVAQDVVPGR